MLPRADKLPDLALGGGLCLSLGRPGSSPRLALLSALMFLGPAGNPRSQGQASPIRIHVKNRWNSPRKEILRLSVPFARGLCRNLAAFSVKGRETAWLALSYWPDGSLQWGQAQFIETLQALEEKDFEIVREARPVQASGDFSAGPRLSQILSGQFLETELLGPFAVRYRAKLAPDPSAGPGGLLQETPLIRVYRFRDYHRAKEASTGIGRDYLSLTAYLTLFRFFEHAELLIILGNDYLGADKVPEAKLEQLPAKRDPNLRPLGSVSFKSFSLLIKNPSLSFVPRFIKENALRPPSPLLDAQAKTIGWRQELIPDSGGWYLGDACSKAFPFILFAREGESAETNPNEEEKLRRQTASAMASAALYPLPWLSDLRKSRAFNAHGGPAPASPGTAAQAQREWRLWQDARHFGPFGSWGDFKATWRNGTPRNGSSALHLALRSGSAKLMRKAHGMCLQQALRPYHLFGLDATKHKDLFLNGLPVKNRIWLSEETLGRREAQAKYAKYRKGLVLPKVGPYGFNAFDYEHMSVDLLYDFYCLTGSAFAREELRVLGQQLMSLLANDKFFYAKAWSSRGEGWCMKALALCYQASRDPQIKKHALARLHRVLDRDRGKKGFRYAVRQAAHKNAMARPWDAPWQQAAYVMGMDAGYRYFEDPLFRDIALDVADHMAGPGWLTGVGPKYMLATDDPKIFRMPTNYSALSGTAEFQIPAFVLAAELAREKGEDDRAKRFLSRASSIVRAHAGQGFDKLQARKWFQLYFDRHPEAAGKGK